MSEDAPSRFWSRLGREHAMDLAAYGFENLKRHQALRYFTWRWSWSSVRRSEQLRFLLRHAGLRSLARAALTRPDLSGPAWDGVEWSKADRWLYTFAVRALWRYALNHGDREVIALAEPELGNPLPVRLSGRLVSQDLANTALEVGTIRQALGATKPASILEIGAGYGRSAYALLSVFSGSHLHDHRHPTCHRHLAVVFDGSLRPGATAVSQPG